MTQRTCSVDDCTDKHLARGYCRKHYGRWRKWGDPLIKYSRWGEDRQATSKVCTKCKRELPIDRFYKRSDGSPVGYVSKCKGCWGPTPEHKRARNLRRYGITVALYDELLARQGGGCAICGAPESGTARPSLSVDHDHATGEVRGLLCFSCNAGIGMLGDNPEHLRTAIRYLELSLRA
jgi:hypothetical protein